MNKNTQKIALSITASILATCGAQAYDLSLGTNLPPVTFHGFASQGFLASSDFNYLGDTTRGSFNFSEAGINASMNPFNRTRITAQGFLFDVNNVGEYYPVLDYASIEYTFNDEFGVRAGRIRRSSGIYNAIQDIDLARTWVLLPQGMYDSRWRDFSCSIDGGEFFGSFDFNKAGSLSYEVYAGLINMAMNGGVAREIEGGLSPSGGFLNDISQCQIYGAQLWYNTPIDGLRFGASGGYIPDFGYNATIPSTPFGPDDMSDTADIPFFQFSGEYLWKNWTFQAEYYTYKTSGPQTSTFPEADYSSSSKSDGHPDSWYAAAAYRFNKWFEAGAYYTEYYANVNDRDGSTLTPSSDAYQKDAALSLRFDPTDWWIVKLEGHLIHGTGLLQDNASNPNRDGRPWYMLAIKTTVSF